MKNHFLFWVFVAGAILFAVQPVRPAEDRYLFRQITPRDGMPSDVRCIYAQKRGFVWIGSLSEGLVRCDNDHWRRYSSQDEGEHALPGDRIYQIVEDSLGRLWVLTDKGLARYRPATDDFYVPKQPHGGMGNLTVHCARPVEGGILFGSQNQIFRYDSAADTIGLLLAFRTERPYPVHAVYPRSDGTLLCFNRWRGLLLLDPKTGEIRPTPFDCQKENACMLVDSRGRVWLAPYNRGIECFDPEGRRIAVYHTGNSALNNDIVLCMAEHNGDIWIGTDGGGINILNPERRTISVLNHIPGDPLSMPDNSIRTLYSNGGGTVWAGRVRGGAIIIRRSAMKMYVETPTMDSFGMSDESVLCLHGDSETDDIWIGTDGGGLDRFDPRMERFTHFPATYGCKIASIAGLSRRELLLSVFSKGLFTFDKPTGRMRPLDYRDSTLQYRMVYSGQTVNLLEESPQTVLLLSQPLYRYHAHSKRLEELDTPESLGSIFPIGSDSEWSWFHDQKRIYRLGNASDRVETVFEIGRDTLLNSVARAGDDSFWLASDKGIGRFSLQTASVEYLPIPFFRGVRSILCDARGRVWAGSDNGVFSLLPDGHCIPFGESEGAAWNEFRPKARLAASDGSVYLGGTEGLLRVDETPLPPESADDPEVELLDVVTDGVRIANRSVEEGLELPWTNKSLSVRIRVLESDPFRKRLYRFRIDRDGYQEEIDSQTPDLTLRNLVPGHYAVYAMCNTPIGRWTPWTRILTCTVNPPWYRTHWFRILLFLGIVATLAGFFFVLLRHKRRLLQQELEHHKQRIAEDKVRFLINISHELRTPLTLILAPLGRLVKQEEAREAEGQPAEAEEPEESEPGTSEPTKEREEAPIEEQIKERTAEQTAEQTEKQTEKQTAEQNETPTGKRTESRTVAPKEKTEGREPSMLRKIYKQAQRMKELIDMVLTLRKMEMGTTTLHPQMRDLNQWVHDIVEDFSLEADERGIDIRIEIDPRIGARCFDAEKCRIVLSNLLSNALKHSPDNSRIVVRTEYDAPGERLRISVIDRGCGLARVNIDRIFTRFYQGDGERSGSGIGLSYAKILVEQHGGTIGASENPEGGAIFHFELPSTLSEQQIVCSPQNLLNDLLESGCTDDGPESLPDLRQKSVLIVEDNESLAAFVKGELEEKTHRLYWAKDGVEALGILERESVDVIVSDIRMPRMNGYELCRQVKNDIAISHIPIILLTVHSDEHSQLLGYKNGADGYLTKPFEIEMLEAAIGSVLRNRELIHSGYRQHLMPEPEESTFSSADEQFLVKLKKIVCDNLQQGALSIPVLCREIGMSRTVLYNKLKLVTGLNIKEYITKIRVEQACVLMRESQLSITEIAERTGFSSSRYFSTVFKQYMGVTPSQYKSSSPVS